MAIKLLNEIATNTACHKHLPLTIAIQNQLIQCYRKESCEDVYSDMILGSIENYNDRDIEFCIPQVKQAISYKYVEICGKKYLPGSIIVSSFKDEGPKFNKIIKILKISRAKI